MTIDELITRINDAKNALQRINASEDVAVKFVLVHQTCMLWIILDSGDLHSREGLSPEAPTAWDARR